MRMRRENAAQQTDGLGASTAAPNASHQTRAVIGNATLLVILTRSMLRCAAAVRRERLRKGTVVTAASSHREIRSRRRDTIA